MKQFLLLVLLVLLPLKLFPFCFDEAGTKYGLNCRLLENIAKVESNLNPKAIHLNSDGSSDLGLMQINSSWLRTLNLNKENLLSNPCYNVMAGAAILKRCILRFGYTWEAVGCYNASSKDKKVDYAWKVFNTMKKGQSGSCGKSVAGEGPTVSFLALEVTDRFEMDRSK